MEVQVTEDNEDVIIQFLGSDPKSIACSDTFAVNTLGDFKHIEIFTRRK